jgi:hypothetical protein
VSYSRLSTRNCFFFRAMYRHRSVQRDGSTDQFMSRMYTDLPLVHSTVDRINSFYINTKHHNRLFRFTLDTAEAGFGLVVATVKPVVDKFEKPIGSLNDMACDRLDKFERDYPIITKPTDVVAKEGMEIYSNVVRPITDRVKPVTDKVSSVAHYSMDKIIGAKEQTVKTANGMKSYGAEKVNSMTSYGVEKVNSMTSYGAEKVNSMTSYGKNRIHAVATVATRKLSPVFENQASQAVVTKIVMAIDIMDSYVEKYLPEEEEIDGKKSPVKGQKVKGEADEQQSILFNKAIQLGCKIHCRAYSRVVKSFMWIKCRSTETIETLRLKTDLIGYGRVYFESMSTKIQAAWLEINKSPEEVAAEMVNDNSTSTALTTERRTIATIRQLRWRLKDVLAAGEQQIAYVAAHIHVIQRDNLIKLSASFLEYIRSPKMIAASVTNAVSKAGSTTSNALSAVSGAALAAVASVAELIAYHLNNSLHRKSDGSEVEETPSDTSNTDQYEDHSCDKHENSSDNSSE